MYKRILYICCCFSLLACRDGATGALIPAALQGDPTPAVFVHQDSTTILAKIAAAAISIEDRSIKYIPDYISIPYPNGDVPAHTGVCTDVVIRTFRKLGIDLQQLVHEDMKANFSSYPKKWGRKVPDTNIDHRRVPNLMTFFSRKGITLPITEEGTDYLPGAIVSWDLPNGMTHIGVVVNQKSADGKRPLILHNIGGGQVVEDCLFKFKITGHYHYPKS